MQQYSFLDENNLNAGAFPSNVPGTLSDCNFSGSVEKVVYFNDDNGQCVLDIKSEELQAHVLLSARLPSIYPGQFIEALIPLSKEEMISHKGPLITKDLQVRPPQSKRTLKKFLKSEAVPEIGPSLAQVLAEAFPENLFSILDHTPEKLLQIKGVGKKRQIQILESWQQFKSQNQFRQFLFDEQLPLLWAQILWPFYKSESQNFLTQHPYQAVTKHGLEFEIVDSLALKEGFPLDSTERIRCGLYDILQTYYKQGHCAYPETKLLEEAREKLMVSQMILEDVLEYEVLNDRLVSESIGETPCIYLKEIWELERQVADKLLAFQFKEPPWGWFHLEKVLNWAQSLLQIQLARGQKEAIETALSSSLTIITGGPGTGKTTLIRSFVTILQTQFSKFALCSPTGRAAQRLEEATGARAQTIHRLLKYNGSTGMFTYNKNNPLDLDLVLIDEFSMVDLALMNHLLDALPNHCALILVGDADQIPSVGAGNVLQSMIDSGRFSTVRLTDIFRQREQSLIKLNAHRINHGEMPLNSTEEGPTDFHYIPIRSTEDAKKAIHQLVTRVIPQQYGITDSRQFQILVPLNKGPLGTMQLNEELQHSVNDSLSVAGFGQNFKVGDKVMVTRNDYKKDVFNGDIGFIEKIDHERQSIEVQFEERSIPFGFDELDRLTLAYAISIHKSQGSEYRAVVVVVTGEHLPMAQRHLIYTAVTRGKEQVFLIADPVALQSAILSDENNRRWQKLTELLKAPRDFENEFEFQEATLN